MSRQETAIVGSIDRRRERASAREERTARQKALQARADALIACQIGELPANDHADFSECLAMSVRRHLNTHHGEPSAAAILSREAARASENLLNRRVASAAAEHAFARLTSAANDRGSK